MSDRERWVIYPLLAMALGVALRDKIIKTTSSQRIQSESLLVADSTGRNIAVLGHERLDPTIATKRDFVSVDVVSAKRIQLTDDAGNVVSVIETHRVPRPGREPATITTLTGHVLVDRLEAQQWVKVPIAEIDELRARIGIAGLLVASDYERIADGKRTSLFYLLDPGSGREAVRRSESPPAEPATDSAKNDAKAPAAEASETDAEPTPADQDGGSGSESTDSAPAS